MTRAISFLSVAAGALVLASATAGAKDVKDVEEIVRRANLAAYYAGRDGRAQVRLTIVDAEGRKRRRVFSVLRRDRQEGGIQDYLVVFTSPADVRRTVFRVAKRPGKDDDRWLYLPALDLVKRIAAGDKRTSFVGSHFLYEDISGRAPVEDRHRLVETSAEQYVVESKPKKASSVEFTSYTVSIDKKTFLPMKIEYEDAKGKVYRRIETLEVKEIGGYQTATKMKVSDLRSRGQTISQVRRVQYDIDLPQEVFSERSLRNPPAKWIKK